MNLYKQYEIYNTDCLSFMRDLPDKKFDVSFTSPPYNRKRNDKYEFYNDDVEHYYEWLCSVIDELLRLTKRHVFFNIQTNYYNRKDVYNLFGKYSNVIVENIIWEKTNPMPANGYNITNSVEYFMVLGESSLKSNTTYTKNIVHSSVNGKMPKIHKGVMHPEISDYFHEKFMKVGDSVFDPFAGIGTTGVSCIKYGMFFTGCEINHEYFTIMKSSLEKSVLETKNVYSKEKLKWNSTLPIF